MADRQECAHEGCDCIVDFAKGVEKDGKNYCCQKCAAGTGCDNPGCACNKK